MTKKSKKIFATLCASAFLLVGGAVLISLPPKTETSYAANTHVDVRFDKVYGLSNTNYIGAEYSGKIYLGGVSDSMLGNNVTFDYANTTAVGTTFSSGDMDAQSLFYHRYLKMQSITNPYSQNGSTLDLSASYYDLYDSDSQTSISGQPLMSMIDNLNRGHVTGWYTNTATYTFTFYYTVSYALDLNGATLKANDGSVPNEVYTAMKNSISNGVMTGALKYDTFNQKWTICGSENVDAALKLFQKKGYDINNVLNESNAVVKTVSSSYSYVTRANATCERLHLETVPRSYNISLDACGGTIDGSSLYSATYDANYPEFPQPTRAGYDFDGWWTKKEGGQEIDSSMKCTTEGEQTLFAHWIAHTYNITFDPGDGQCSVSSTVVTCGQPYGKGTGLDGSLPIATKVGYAFNGWWTTPSDSGTKITSATIVGPIEADQTLYARYIAGAENVYLNGNGGFLPEGVDDIKIVKFDSPYGTLPTPTRNDYQIFLGWYTAKEGGELVTSETIVSNPENHVLYAHWGETWFNHMSQSLSQDANGNYLISSAQDLALLVYQSITQVATEPISCLQTCDIDLSQNYWPDITPEVEGAQFYGTYDGGYHIIRGMHNGESYTNSALFYSVKGSVLNLSSLDVDLRGENVAGIVIDFLDGDQLKNCAVSGNITATKIAGGLIAKIVGWEEELSQAQQHTHEFAGLISLCTNNANITAQGCDYVGGIVGYIYYRMSTSDQYDIDEFNEEILNIISMCTNNGTIIGGEYVGGIVGYGFFGKWVQIKNKNEKGDFEFYSLRTINCINTGKICGGKYAGGIIGGMWQNGGIAYCYNYGSFEGTKNITYCGGIIGYGSFGTIGTCYAQIQNCIFEGSVANGYIKYFGGILGKIHVSGYDAAYLRNSYVNVSFSSYATYSNYLCGIVGDAPRGIVTKINCSNVTVIVKNAKITEFGDISYGGGLYILSEYDDTASCVYYDYNTVYDGVFCYDENKLLFEGLPVPVDITFVGPHMTQTNIIDYLSSYVTERGGEITKLPATT